MASTVMMRPLQAKQEIEEDFEDQEVFLDAAADIINNEADDSLFQDSVENNGNCGEEDKENSPCKRLELSHSLLDLARRELGETPEVRARCLAEMKDWLRSQPHLRGCVDGGEDGNGFRLDQADSFLLRFLRAQKFQVKKANKMLDKYMATRLEHPEWFTDLDPINDKHMQELVDSGYVFVLPERDLEGRRVVFNWASALDPTRHTSADTMRTFMATLDTLMMDEENQIRGLTYIFYCRNLTLAHCGIWTPTEAANMFTSCEKSLPIRHRKIHMVHLPLTLWAIMEFAKSFLSYKIKSRFDTVSDDEKLRCRLNSDILPLELGGNTPLADMTKYWRQELNQNSSKLRMLDDLKIIKAETKEAKKDWSSSFWSAWWPL